MAVDLERDSRVGVADPITKDLGLDAGVERQRRVRMPHIVEPNPPGASCIDEAVGRKGPRRCPGSCRDSDGLGGIALADPESTQVLDQAEQGHRRIPHDGAPSWWAC